MNAEKVADDLLAAFRREHPFTLVPHEVRSLIVTAAKNGYIAAEVDKWCPEQ